MEQDSHRILFIHAPKKCTDTYGTNVREIMALPAGLFALASICKKAGWTTEIVHLGIEEILRPGFNAAETVRAYAPRVVAFSLQWHQQLAEVKAAASKIKQLMPEVMIIAGGITASYFAHQIMESFRYIDAIISGDAERPLLELLKTIENAKTNEFTEVPNLSWRINDRIIHNARSYICDNETIDGLDYADVTLLRNADHYSGAIEHPRRGNGNDSLWGTPRIAHIVTGRGCTRNCSYCSGSATNQMKTFFRKGVVMRSPQRVSEDIRKFIGHGFDSIYFSFAPPGTDEYYFRLFEILERNKITPETVSLEYFGGLPSAEFLSRFSRICEAATVVLSPASAVRAARLFNKLPDYSNDELEESICVAAGTNVKTEIYFSLLPNDTPKSLEKTLKWAARLHSSSWVNCKIVPIEIEPGSDWYEHPDRYGLTLLRRSLKEFVDYHAGDRPFRLSEKLGYTIESEEEKTGLLGRISFVVNR